MKKYLSSQRLWNTPEKYLELLWSNKKIAFVTNACDAFNDSSIFSELDLFEKDCKKLWLEIERLDLREYFWKYDELKAHLSNFWWILVAWGNTFVLRQAFRLSWLDDIICKFEKEREDFVYAWWSAWICILAPSLVWIEICDDAECYPYDDLKETIWEGLWILDYSISPHYRSNHVESEMTEKEIQYYIDNKRLFKALRDGEVLIYD